MTVKHFFAALAVSGLLAAPPLAAETDLQKSIKADYGYLDDLFKHFHANPELSFQEVETAARLTKELEHAGFTVTQGVGHTGIVAIMENGEGPTVLVRADMDGLPVKEKSGLAYASTRTQFNREGVEMPTMHACGHDMHITSMVGLARQMTMMKDKWQGTLMLVGQPAEEIVDGAEAMIADGLYERFGVPDYALALHVASAVPTGFITYREGTMFSASDSLRITVKGVGTHGAAPQHGKDPVVIASQLVTALQTIVSREISPLDPAIITVGTFHAGTKGNIISDHAVLNLSVRSNSDDVRDTLLSAIKRTAEGIARTNGLPEDKMPVIEHLGSTLVTDNDPELTARLDETFQNKFGADRIIPYVQRNMGAEDFTFFTRTEHDVPGFYYMVGGTPQEDFDAAANGGPGIPGHHSPIFKISPEPSIKIGVESMTIAAIDLLQK